MKIIQPDAMEPPKSSFVSLSKDLEIIIMTMLKNPRLKKMLYYNVPECLNSPDCPNLTDEQTVGLIHHQIRVVPKLEVEEKHFASIIVTFDSFIPSVAGAVDERDSTIMFDIICHYNQWNMKNFQARPYMLASEIDSMFNNKHIGKIGDLSFMGAHGTQLNDEFYVLTLVYSASHVPEEI